MVTLVTNMELDLEEQALKEQFIEEYGVDTEEAGSTPGITFNANYGERVGLGDVLVGNAGSGLAVLLVSIFVVIFTSLGVLTWLVAMLEGKLAAISPFMEKIIARLGLSQYMIVTRISGLKLYPVFPYVSSLVVAVIGIAVYLTLGMLIHCKRDTI